MSYDRSPPRAQRSSNGDFLSPRQSFSEHKISHVGASDEQNENNRTQQHQQRRPNVAHQLFAQRHNRGAPSLIVFRILLLETLRDASEFGFSLANIHARFQPGNDHIVVIAANHPLLIGPTKRNPNLRPTRQTKVFRHHSDNRIRLRINRDVASSDRRIGSEMIAPKFVAQHHHLRSSAGILVSRERPPPHGMRPEQREEFWRDGSAEHRFGLSLAAKN